MSVSTPNMTTCIHNIYNTEIDISRSYDIRVNMFHMKFHMHRTLSELIYFSSSRTAIRIFPCRLSPLHRFVFMALGFCNDSPIPNRVSWEFASPIVYSPVDSKRSRKSISCENLADKANLNKSSAFSGHEYMLKFFRRLALRFWSTGRFMSYNKAF